jgi:fatty acyl-CoA reductase
MRGMPNTYAVSKLLTEELVFRFSDRIRFVITRPAVVISAWQEPMPGYVDNKKNGMIGPMMARASGILRTILSNPDKPTEFIPVDIATHAIIAMTCKRGLLDGSEILYCNIVDTKTKPWTFGQYFELEMNTFYKYPLRNQLWWPYCVVTGNRFYYNFRRVFYHYLPAAIGDFWTVIFRRKPQ